jgi:hypothetical protein
VFGKVVEVQSEEVQKLQLNVLASVKERCSVVVKGALEGYMTLPASWVVMAAVFCLFFWLNLTAVLEAEKLWKAARSLGI